MMMRLNVSGVDAGNDASKPVELHDRAQSRTESFSTTTFLYSGQLLASAFPRSRTIESFGYVLLRIGSRFARDSETKTKMGSAIFLLSGSSSPSMAERSSLKLYRIRHDSYFPSLKSSYLKAPAVLGSAKN